MKLCQSLLALSLFAGVAAPAVAAVPAYNTLSGAAPIVIGHRGASGYRPEHTLAAYDLAISQGANYIEPDLVMTKDGVLVARHENAIAILNTNGSLREATTNVHELAQFANRKTTRMVDGAAITGWFVEDFTLAELKTLKARERIPQLRTGNVAYDDQFEVPTLQEVIDLAKTRSAQLGRTIGVYPELKHSTYMSQVSQSLGFSATYFEDKLVETLHANYGNDRNAPVFIQSFEVANLQYINGKTDMKIAQLLNGSGKPYDFVVSGDGRSYIDLASGTGLEFINDYADGIGATKSLIIPTIGGVLGSPTTLVADAHARGLEVHAWTFRAENQFLPNEFDQGSDPRTLGDMKGELAAYLALGLDGVFTDHPDLGVAAVSAIPEPKAIAMLLVGLGVIGGIARRRNRH